MKNIFFIFFLFFSGFVWGQGTNYYGVTISTTAGQARQRIVGRIEVSASSQTITSPTIVLHGPNKRLTVRDGANVSTITATGFQGNGANLTSLTAANIASGWLGSGVIASSVALEGFYSDNNVRTNLGLAIGTDVQAYDADLADLADGSLTGSKVGSGVPAANIASGWLGAEVIVSSFSTNPIFNGNTGIGTTSPAFSLDVAGVVRSTRMAVASSMGLESLSCSAGQSIGGATVAGGIISAGSCIASGGGDAVLSATQTFTGQNTFQNQVTVSSHVDVTGEIFGTIHKTTATILTATSFTGTTFSANPCVTGSSLTVTLSETTPLNFVFFSSWMSNLSNGYKIIVTIKENGAVIDWFPGDDYLATDSMVYANTSQQLYFDIVRSKVAGTYNYCIGVAVQDGHTATVPSTGLTYNGVGEFYITELR